MELNDTVFMSASPGGKHLFHGNSQRAIPLSGKHLQTGDIIWPSVISRSIGMTDIL
jgi:hypothetical protein